MTAAESRQSGFTIIEILIVLAVGGLILLVILLAVPALQRNARNTQRRHDVAQTLALIQEYTLLNKNNIPDSCNNTWPDCFLRNMELSYYDNESLEVNNVSLWNREGLGPFNDVLDHQLDPNDPISSERISVRTWSKCNGGLITGDGAKERDAAAQFVIETFSGGSLQCVQM
jgi:prepilin-type N-terminal cleavage/methylation domain-containing protein